MRLLFQVRQILQDKAGQGKEPCFAGDGSLGPAFFLIRKIEFLHIRQFLSLFDGIFELRRQLALLLNLGQNSLLALSQSGQRLVQIDDALDDYLIQITRGFLAVAGDERDSVAFGR